MKAPAASHEYQRRVRLVMVDKLDCRRPERTKHGVDKLDRRRLGRTTRGADELGRRRPGHDARHAVIAKLRAQAIFVGASDVADQRSFPGYNVPDRSV